MCDHSDACYWMWAWSYVTKIFQPPSKSSKLVTLDRIELSEFSLLNYLETTHAKSASTIRHASEFLNTLLEFSFSLFVGIKSEPKHLKISIDRLVKTFPDNTILLLPQKPFFHFPRNQTVIFHTCKWLYFCKNAVLWNLRTIPGPSPWSIKPNQGRRVF